ncbi:hypothetical protein I5M32_15925 [Pedobacter sp. SD-b]|uniref:Uncharacterized protein n=1 Tax=Pedobacter segetis TaxID=2793069 RepID=A0ABS1BNI8_9SPHI|nr:hypothetical protein [Pedobacter segetis]MBK0384454.1 hypothetical protein [Pedobacter segetis]
MNISKNQVDNLREFCTNYPEFLKFSKDEKVELFKVAQRSIINEGKLFDKTNYYGEEDEQLGDCLFDFNISMNTCERNYNTTTIVIWSNVAIVGFAGMISTGGAGVAILGVALVAQAANLYSYEGCIDDAGDQFAHDCPDSFTIH